MHTNRLIIIFFVFTLFSCDTNVKNNPQEDEKPILIIDTIPIIQKSVIPEIEKNLINEGLVDIQKIDTTIKIDLRYSTPNNFVGIDLYGDLSKVYMQPDVADKIVLAQQYLKEVDSSLSLLIFDGVRPHHIQQLMWDTLKIPFHEKTKFLSNPKNHSVHNYGAAIDLTIINSEGEELDMGTPYDYIGKLCYPRLEKQFLISGELTQHHINNRQLLRDVMKKAKFRYLPTEWWHFNSCSRREAKIKYKLIP